MSLLPLVTERRVLVCVGSGGVGKTTTSASLALAAALAGRRVLVMTIDPARRLANSLGLDGMTHEVRRIPDERLAVLGDGRPRGELWAMMLDQKSAFDDIVAMHASNESSRRQILQNPIYRQVSGSLAGAHEYAAMSKLCEVAASASYDLVILDTPPTSNALDFLDAPERLIEAIESPALQWLVKPYLEGGSFSFQALGLGAAFVMKRLARFVGSKFFEHVAQFLAEFNTVLAGFRQRAQEVDGLLHRKDSGFVLVSAPDPMAVDEALFFGRQLAEQKLELSAVVVNRVHRHEEPPPARAQIVEAVEELVELRGFGGDDYVQFAADLDRTYREFGALAEADALEIARLKAGVSSTASLVEVPFFDADIHDLEALGLIVQRLTASPSSSVA